MVVVVRWRGRGGKGGFCDAGMDWGGMGNGKWEGGWKSGCGNQEFQIAPVDYLSLILYLFLIFIEREQRQSSTRYIHLGQNPRVKWTRVEILTRIVCTYIASRIRCLHRDDLESEVLFTFVVIFKKRLDL